MLEEYKDILTTDDLYEILPIGRNAIYNLVKNKELKTIRIGKKILILKESLIDYLKSA